VVVGNGRRGYSRTIAATIEVRRSVEKVIVENCTKRRMEEEERMHRKKKIKRQDRGGYGSAVQRQEANSGQENGKKLGWEKEGLKHKRENTRGRRAGDESKTVGQQEGDGEKPTTTGEETSLSHIMTTFT